MMKHLYGLAALIWLAGVCVSVSAPAQETFLTDWGAVPDDGRDDAGAFQKALEYLMKNGGGTLIVPPGRYDFMTNVAVRGTFRNIRIEGRGHNISRLICRNQHGVLRLEAENPTAAVEICDLDIAPAQPAAGAALVLIKPYSAPADVDYNLRLYNLELRPEDIVKDYFTHAISAHGWKPLIDNVSSSGPFGPHVTDEVRALSASALVLGQAFQPRLRHCHFWAARMGVYIELTDAHAEPTILGTVSVLTGQGIYIVRRGNRPLSHPVRLVNNHWNNRKGGLRLEGVDAFHVTGCMPYCEVKEMPPSGFTDVELIRCSRGLIEDNMFWFGSVPRALITVDAACHDISIRNNLFGLGTSRLPVRIEKGARDIRVDSNVYESVYANDEGDTFALWEMDHVQDAVTPDKDGLHPGRGNDLKLQGAAIKTGRPATAFGSALFFAGSGAAAFSRHDWDGAPGVRLRLWVLCEPSKGPRTILDVPGAFRLEAVGGDLRWVFKNAAGEEVFLKVPGGAAPGYWRNVRAEVDPVLGCAVLEVEGVSGQRRFLKDVHLAPVKAPLRMAPPDQAGSFSGALDQVWVQRLGVGK